MPRPTSSSYSKRTEKSAAWQQICGFPVRFRTVLIGSGRLQVRPIEWIKGKTGDSLDVLLVDLLLTGDGHLHVLVALVAAKEASDSDV
jgi:hypothetical protein